MSKEIPADDGSDGFPVPSSETVAEISQSDNRIIHAALALLQEVLGRHLLGAYLSGSAVLSGLRPHSDIDLLASTRRGLRSDERLALSKGLLRISGKAGRAPTSRSIELTVFAESSVSPWKHPPTLEYLYGEWLRDEFESQNPPAYPVEDPDLTTILASARQSNLRLVGTPIEVVVAEIPERDVVQSMRDGIPDLLADIDSDTVNVVLTFTRIWYTLANRSFVSKDRAARWVLSRLPDEHCAAIRLAIDAYLGKRVDETAEFVESARSCIEWMNREIDRR